jgi:DNA primase
MVATALNAGLELHPRSYQPVESEQPGRLVLDLDPAADASFDGVIAGAR